MGRHDSGYKLLFSHPYLIEALAYPADDLRRMRNPVACLLWLEGSRQLETTPIEELDAMLDPREHAELRRACALWVTQDLLPSRLPGVTVPEVKKLEEVRPMIAENAIDWTIPWMEEGRREGRRQGEAEGLRKGEATLLLRMLKQKYGPLAPDLEARVERADVDRLLEWGERFVDASTLGEIFDGKGD